MTPANVGGPHVNRGPGFSGFTASRLGIIPSDVIDCGLAPFFRREVSGEVIVDTGGIADGHRDLLPFSQWQRLQRVESAVLIHRLNCPVHTSLA